MGKPYSLDLRERVVSALEQGMSTRQAAARFSVGIATVGTWGRLKRCQGDVRPARQGKPRGSVVDAHEGFILGVLRRSVMCGGCGRRFGSSSTAAARRIKKDGARQRARAP